MTAIATFAGGCFWCIETVFAKLRGVESAISGYTGGTLAEPSYHEVCSGRTGHAEAVEIHFDPAVVSYRQLLEVFFAIHDPTTLNRQGNDVGTQYRSAIFYHDTTQLGEARAIINALEEQHGCRIVTELVPATVFYPAETGHQGYYDANPGQPYCQIVIAPKVRKLMTHFAELTR